MTFLNVKDAIKACEQQGIRTVLREVERTLVVEALKDSCWNTARAGRLLGCGRSTLVMKRRKLGLPLAQPKGGGV